MAVVEDSAELDGGKLISQCTDVPVESEALKVDMSSTQNSGSRRLVASAGLDTDESILNDIDPANTVLPSKGVEGVEDVDSIGILLGVARDDNTDGETGLELDCDAFRSFGCLFRSSS